MGSGSSRSGRALRRLRSPDSRPAGPGGAARRAGRGCQSRRRRRRPGRRPGRRRRMRRRGRPDPDPDPDPRRPPTLLAESAAWGPGELAPRGPARPRPAAGAGSPVSPERSTEDHPESSSVSEAPGSCHKRPEGQSAITYDYSEEELMASIEQEYCC
uniref:Cystin 1 n=1 Tax=Balaenoptera musculus TaxID=9771 RepID=A0A8C0DUK5_BALMU